MHLKESGSGLIVLTTTIYKLKICTRIYSKHSDVIYKAEVQQNQW